MITNSKISKSGKSIKKSKSLINLSIKSAIILIPAQKKIAESATKKAFLFISIFFKFIKKDAKTASFCCYFNV